MADLVYSTGALRALPSFHRQRRVIYVEGPDDVPFWQGVLGAAGLQSFVVKTAGGASAIDAYIHDIVAHDVPICAARDCDYLWAIGTMSYHPRVLYTLGYSVENSIYSPKNIARLVGVLTRDGRRREASVRSWLSHECGVIRLLTALDVAARADGAVVGTLSNNCCALLAAKAPKFSLSAIVSAVDNGRTNLTLGALATARDYLARWCRPLWMVPRGHFLTHLVYAYVRHSVLQVTGKAPKLSIEAMTAALMGTFGPDTADEGDWTYLMAQARVLL
jgi:hypothetical protein